MEKIRWDILGLAEVRKKGEKLIIRKNGNLFYYYRETKGFRGIGFYLARYLKNRVLECKGIIERIGCLKIRIGKGINVTIIQVYAPTAMTEEEELMKFYENLNKVIETEKEYCTVIMGDLTLKLGKGNNCWNLLLKTTLKLEILFF